MVASLISKQVAKEAEEDHERAVKEHECQTAYQSKRARVNEVPITDPIQQLYRDQEELKRIMAEEKRLQDAKIWMKPGMEEAQQCDIRLVALRDQKQRLWDRLTDLVNEQQRQQQQRQQSEGDEDQSRVEIKMDTEELDTTIAEQGKLPEATQLIEEKVYSRLVK